MPVPRSLPRVVTTGEALAVGATPDAIDHAVLTGRWRRLARGVLLTAAGPVTRDDWILVGMAVSGPDGALSGWDAVRIRGVGDRTPPSPRVLVLDRAGGNRRTEHLHVRPTRRGYDSDLLPVSHPTLPLVPVVTPARAVADTALMYRSDRAVRALVTASVQRRLSTPQDLVDELAACPRNNSKAFRRSLADVLDNAHSVAEAEAVAFLRTAPVPRFEVNVPVVDSSGTVVWIVDVLWRELRAALEIDSREFHFAEQDWQATMSRHNALTTLGLALAHYPPSDVRRRRHAWAGEVANWLRARARELGVPYRPGGGAVRPGVDGPLPYVA